MQGLTGKRCKDAGNKELVDNSHESRREEELLKEAKTLYGL
jgi:hypothetical protein